MSNETQEKTPLARKDYLSTIEPKWCPGCGCFPILKSLTTMFAAAGIPREKIVVISGIGCSSRTPYYLSTYGFHTIHGRAATVATGLTLSRPDLAVWVVTGDGDALAIGGNHFIHLMRRNPRVKMLLFNNQIYGLTKGQASPTTAGGTKTKTTPFGAHEPPTRPLALAIAAGATFVARVPDSDPALMTEVLAAAHAHQGVAMVEIIFNCITFNDGAYKLYTDKEERRKHTVRIEHGKPLIYGVQDEMTLVAKGFCLVPTARASLGTGQELLAHDARSDDGGLAYLLALMDDPYAFGIFRQVQRPVCEARYPLSHPPEELHRFLQGDSAWMVG
jgi:2-oxoglutarate/2-oxoacid ferredoxin oxidoreductase subunit beta